MRLSLTLSLYIMRQFLLSVLLVFCVFGTFIFLVNVLELIKRTHDQNVPFAMILQMALLKLPQVGQKALPFTVLLGTVLTYTRFTRTQELTVMRSAGVSVWQFLMPALLWKWPIATTASCWHMTDFPVRHLCDTTHERSFRKRMDFSWWTLSTVRGT